MRKFVCFISFFCLTGCEVSSLPVVRIKLKSIYQRDLQRWVIANPGKTYDTPKPRYPAIAFENGSMVFGKLSLHGDLSRHWAGPQKSFRFSASRNHFSRQEISYDLILPVDKDREYEPLGLELAKSLGLLTPNWSFVRLVLNHRDQGPYYKLENLTPSALELRGLPEGEIIREANAWLDVIRIGPSSRYQDVYSGRDSINPLSLRSEIYRSTFNTVYTPFALSRFNEFLSALSVGTWREYISLSDATSWVILMSTMGSFHGNLGDNIKWYYHPFERKFRPIPYDFLPESLLKRACAPRSFAKMNPWVKAWMNDSEFRKELKRKILALRSLGWPNGIIREFYSRSDVREISGSPAVARSAMIARNARILFMNAESPDCL